VSLLSRLWNVENRRCSRCYGEVEIVDGDNGQQNIRCKSCGHENGHVSAVYVELQKMRQEDYTRTVARAYPELARENGIETTTAAAAAAAANALFGGGFTEKDYEAITPERSKLPAGYMEDPDRRKEKCQ